ncbi:hypothetical protein HW555_008286, partial [Spodoptera exigua]
MTKGVCLGAALGPRDLKNINPGLRLSTRDPARPELCGVNVGTSSPQYGLESSTFFLVLRAGSWRDLRGYFDLARAFVSRVRQRDVDLSSVRSPVITTIKVNFNKDSDSRKNAEYIKKRLGALDALWEEFEQNHSRISDHASEADEYFRLNTYQVGKDLYQSVRILLSSYGKSSKSTQPDGEVDELLAMQRTNFRALSRLIKSIKVENISDKWELEDELNGVQSIWKIIDAQHLKIDHILAGGDISYDEEFTRHELYDTTTECIHAIHNLGVNTNAWDPLLVHLLCKKLDTDTQTDYREARVEPRKLPKLDELMTFLEVDDEELLLTTLSINVRCSDGTYITLRALLDQGSQISLISENAVQRLGLQRRRYNASVSGIGSGASQSKGLVSIDCQSIYGDYNFTTEALVLSRVASNLPSVQFKKQSWPHLQHLQLADPEYNVSKPIDLLLD